MWLAYGVALNAAPVIVANVIVVALALWSARTTPRSAAQEPTGSEQSTASAAS